MRNKDVVRRVLIYAALAAGALVFAWPFLWMASTSAKLDREMFEGHGLLAQRPVPRVQSPYIDERHYGGVSGPHG